MVGLSEHEDDFISKEIAKQREDFLKRVKSEVEFKPATQELKGILTETCFICKIPNTCKKPGICSGCMAMMSYNSYLDVYGDV